MASLATLASNIRDAAVALSEKIIHVHEGVQQEYLAHVAACQALRTQFHILGTSLLQSGPTESVVLETKTGHLQVVKPKSKSSDAKSEFKGDWSWKRPYSKYGRYGREESLPGTGPSLLGRLSNVSGVHAASTVCTTSPEVVETAVVETLRHLQRRTTCQRGLEPRLTRGSHCWHCSQLSTLRPGCHG
eukprot:1340289-Amphidinium_carterae.2